MLCSASRLVCRWTSRVGVRCSGVGGVVLCFYSYTNLNIPATVRYDVNLNHKNPQGRLNIIKLTITKVAAVAPRDLMNVLDGAAHTNLSRTLLQIFNILVRQAAIADMSYKGNSLSTQSGYPPHNRLEVWRGYFQSVRPL